MKELRAVYPGPVCPYFSITLHPPDLRNLYESLRTSSPTLRYVDTRSGTHCSPRAMTLIVLAAICLLACLFLLFVLFQWTRDTKRKTTTRTAVDKAARGSKEKTRLQVAARASTEKHDRFSGKSRWAQSRSSQSRGCGSGCNECEPTAYEKVARSLRSSKRT